jgi:hypothetical protein
VLDRTVQQLRQRWGPLDPARGDDWRPGPEVRRRTLEAILASGPPDLPTTATVGTPRPAPRRRILVAAAATTVAFLAAVTSIVAVNTIGTQPAFAATPAPLEITAPTDAVPAAERLQRTATTVQRSAGSAAVPPADRSVEHRIVAQWALHTRIGGQRVDSAVIPTRRESWRTADNAGRVVERHLPAVFRSDQERRAWQDAGSPGADPSTRRSDFPAREFPALWAQRPPTTVPALRAWLGRNHSGGDATADAIADLLGERVLTPPERVALLRVLAGIPGLTFAGTTTDRAGRRGEVYSVVLTASGLPTTYTFIIDPGTGIFLAHERALTTDAGRLNVRLPAVIRYDTYLTAEFVAAMP